MGIEPEYMLCLVTVFALVDGDWDPIGFYSDCRFLMLQLDLTETDMHPI
jgi:hypothetical protein